MRKVAVIGVGLHRYGKWDNKTSFSLAKEAIDGALKTSNLEWNQIQSGWCGHTGQGIAAGERIFMRYGKTGLSITNVENASASGSYAFRGAYLEVALGEFDTALALGIDKRSIWIRNPRNRNKFRRPSPIIQKFAQDARFHMEKYGTTVDQLAMVSVKNHYNGSLNPYAQFQEELTIEAVHNAPMMDNPLTILHCTSTSDGAAACILASEDKVKELGISKPVWISASVSKSEIDPKQDSRDITAITAQEAYKRVGIGPSDLGLVELHEAFTIEEISISEQLGLCPIGEGGKLVKEGATAIEGRIPINTSGGLLAMGHPIGPTGIGQVAEVYLQMRGEAGKRQIPVPPKYALTQMIGFGGSCIIHIFSR